MTIPFKQWGRQKIVTRPFTYKETMNGITNSSRKKTAYNVFYSTLCAELKTESHADQRIIMGDDLLRPFQQQLISDDLAAQADADDDLDADDLAEAEDDDDDDDDGHRYDAYFDIRVKRRMVRLIQVVVLSFCFYFVSTNVRMVFFLFVSILFP